MDKIRGPFSRLKKKLKERPTGSDFESQRKESGVHRENIDSVHSPPRAEPCVVAGGRHDREGNRTNTDRRRIRSVDLISQPDELESMPAHGSENDREKREAGVDGRAVGQRYSQLLPDVEVVVGSGRREGSDPSGWKVERTYPSPSAALTPHNGIAPESK